MESGTGASCIIVNTRKQTENAFKNKWRVQRLPSFRENPQASMIASSKFLCASLLVSVTYVTRSTVLKGAAILAAYIARNLRSFCSL